MKFLPDQIYEGLKKYLTFPSDSNKGECEAMLKETLNDFIATISENQNHCDNLQEIILEEYERYVGPPIFVSVYEVFYERYERKLCEALESANRENGIRALDIKDIEAIEALIEAEKNKESKKQHEHLRELSKELALTHLGSLNIHRRPHLKIAM